MSMIGLGGVIEVPGTAPWPAGGAAAPQPGERTQRQRGPISWGMGGMGAMGGTGMPPALGAPAFDGATTGIGWADACGGGTAQIFGASSGNLGPLWSVIFLPSYATYRLMRSACPALALARSLVFTPIIGAQRAAESVNKLDPAPEPWIRFANDRLVPTYRRAVPDMLRALDFGHAKFEKVWQMVEGLWEYEKLKPLNPEGAVILSTRSGSFAGLRPIQSRPDGAEDLGLVKSFLYTYDGEGGDLLGRSRFENVRSTSWADWIDTLLSSRKLKDKLAGIIPIFYHPPGGFEDPPGSGNWVQYQDACRRAADRLMQGDYITVEHYGFSQADIRNNPDLIKAGEVSVDFYDAGNLSAAQSGMVKQLEYDDKNLMRGYLKPERAGLASTSGTRADAEVHTASGSEDGETITEDMDEQFRAGAVDDVMVLNFGERARGKVRIRTAPLEDETAAMDAAIISDLIKGGMGAEISEALDMDAIFARRELPAGATKWAEVLKAYRDRAAKEAEAKAAAPAGPGAPGGGRIGAAGPGSNGNGR